MTRLAAANPHPFVFFFFFFLFFLPRMEVYLVFCILALRSPLRLALCGYHSVVYWNQIHQVDFTY